MHPVKCEAGFQQGSMYQTTLSSLCRPQWRCRAERNYAEFEHRAILSGIRQFYNGLPHCFCNGRLDRPGADSCLQLATMV